MGENRDRIIWLENDVADLKKRLDTLQVELAAVGIEANSFEEELTSQGAAINEMAETVAKFTLNANNRIMASNDAKVWLSEMDASCRQARDSVQAIHAWQNQMSKELSAQICRINSLFEKVREVRESRLKLAGIADDRIRDLERALDEATEQNRGVVSRMEQLETRLRRLEDSQVRVTLSPNKTVHIPEAIHCGGPISVKLEPNQSTIRPGQIMCEGDRA